MSAIEHLRIRLADPEAEISLREVAAALLELAPKTGKIPRLRHGMRVRYRPTGILGVLIDGPDANGSWCARLDGRGRWWSEAEDFEEVA